jgi:hypothetical protein
MMISLFVLSFVFVIDSLLWAPMYTRKALLTVVFERHFSINNFNIFCRTD